MTVHSVRRVVPGPDSCAATNYRFNLPLHSRV